MVLVVCLYALSPFVDGIRLLVCMEDYMLKGSLHLSGNKRKTMSVTSLVSYIP